MEPMRAPRESAFATPTGATRVRAEISAIARTCRRNQRIARKGCDRLGARRDCGEVHRRGSPASSSSAAPGATNRRFTPGSLKRLATVGNTGTSSSGNFMRSG
jgi:hypothetical protein